MFSSLLCILSLAVTYVVSSPVNTTELFRRAPAQVVTKCVVPNTAALTFDDGPYVYLYDVSKALIAAGAKGTFFFNGNNFGCIYNEDQAKRVKYAHDKGHQIASHTWSHGHLKNMNWDQLHHEFWLMEDAIRKITGVAPAFVRPPFGEYNDLVREAAGVRGMTLANWDFDSGDTWGISTEQVKQRYTDIANQRPSNLIALNHDVHQQSAQVVLPHAIKVLQAKGYKLVTLAECLGMPAYHSVGAPSARDASWTCADKPQLQV